MVRCNNIKCPQYSKCQRPLDFDDNHIKLSARYNYESNEEKNTPCFKPIKESKDETDKI